MKRKYKVGYKRPPEATQFKPGVSGNPHGRPKGSKTKLKRASGNYTDHIRNIANEIAETLIRKDAEYGGSWLKRGGVGAYMMKVRKSDRLEEQVKRRGYDVFKAMQDTAPTSESIAETLLDDAGYAILILAEARARGIVVKG